MTPPKYALTGASGMLGAPIVRALQARGVTPRILSSRAASVERLRALGVTDIVAGTFQNPNDLARLLDGIDTVLHIPPSVAPDEAEIGIAMIEAAERAGVRHVAFMSCYHSIIPEMRHHVNKLRVEQALTASSLAYTILQPAMFMQNLGFIWSKVKARGVVEWPWDPEQHYAMVDVADIAEATAIAITVPRFEGGTFELCGDDVVTVTAMAGMIGEAMGRDICAGRQDVEEWISGMAAAGAPAWSIETVRGMCAYHDAHGYAGGSSFVLESILGRKPTPYADFAKRWVAEQRAITT